MIICSEEGILAKPREKTLKEEYYDLVEKNILLLKQKSLRCCLSHFHLLTILSKEKIYTVLFNGGHKFIQLFLIEVKIRNTQCIFVRIAILKSSECKLNINCFNFCYSCTGLSEKKTEFYYCELLLITAPDFTFTYGSSLGHHCLFNKRINNFTAQV